MCNRKNFFLIDHCKSNKASHLNSSRVHLNRKGDNILSLSLTHNISKVFSWQLSGNTSCCNVSETDFEKNESSNLKQAKENFRSVLNSLHNYNLIYFCTFMLNLLVSENKIDDSFLQGQCIIDILKIYSQKIGTFVQTCFFKNIFDKFGRMLTSL